MALEYLEQLELDNSVEHLKVVRSNLRIVSGELSNIFEQVKVNKTYLKEVIETRELLQAANTKWILEQKERSEQLTRSEAHLVTRETTISIKEEEIRNKIAQAKEELNNINHSIIIASTKLVAIGVDNSIQKSENELFINNLKTQTREYEEKAKERLQYSTSLKNEIIRLHTEKEEAEKDLNLFRNNSLNEIEETRKILDEEKNKVANPREALRRENELLNRKTENLEILQVRIRNQYLKLYPDRILPIELQ